MGVLNILFNVYFLFTFCKVYHVFWSVNSGALKITFGVGTISGKNFILPAATENSRPHSSFDQTSYGPEQSIE